MTNQIEVLSGAIASERRTNIRSTKAACRRIRREHCRLAGKYGRLPAERQSLKVLRESNRSRLRQVWMSRKGRRIDLLGLLSQKREDNGPAWAVVDPLFRIDSKNGGVDKDGTYHVASMPEWVAKKWRVGDQESYHSHETVTVPGLRLTNATYPEAIPPLPAKARKLVHDLTIRRRAKWVGLLYQPDTWSHQRPDPAIVVEWQDLPGQYFALCVWGTDKARIMEWVD